MEADHDDTGGSVPRVSVIVPTFDRSVLVRRAIDSVLAQDEPSVEIVVIDDGSTDDTQDRLRELAGRDGRIVYRRQARGGVVSARNHGLSVASGAHIAFLDSDDVW